MAHNKRIPQPSAHVLELRPRLAPDASRSNNRIDEFDLQQDWQARICSSADMPGACRAAQDGLIKVVR